MGNSISIPKEEEEEYGFIILDEQSLDEQSRYQELLQKTIQGTEKALVFTKTAMTLTVCAIGSALTVLGGITASASTFIGNSLAVKQDFQTNDSYTVLRFEKINFFIIEKTTGQTLGFSIGNRVCGFKFNLDISKIEMFRLTENIGFFLFHTNYGNTVVSVYTNQYDGNFNRLILTTITDSYNQFERFEASEPCMYGTVSLTVFYKNGTQKYFQIERNGTFNEDVLP